ncbi:MAG: hypothetical protein OEL53_12430 [Rhodospirillales bacterium]|nr:hypothetical protein [Rhodospirillales bacterium]
MIDADKLTATQLRQKYKSTYDNWRNMKTRESKGAVIADEFRAFKDFLRHMGPRPSQDDTLDRIDNRNPKYGPGLCRWLDKRGQANNRSTTIYLTCNGVTKPLTTWAEEIGVKATTIRDRKKKGLSDYEAIYGRSRDASLPRAVRPDNPYARKPWPHLWPDNPERCEQWEQDYQASCAKSGHILRFDYCIMRLNQFVRRAENA